MEARAKLFGHPIHQMLIVLPLGLLMGAVLFDIVHLIARGDQWSIVSYWLIPAGILTGLLAGVFGFADYLKIPSDTRAKRIGRLHGIGNIVVLVLFALSFLVRGNPLDEPSGFALLLSFVGGGLSLLTGWLGGELVDRLGVGVSDGANLNAPSSMKESHVEQAPHGRRAA